MNMHRLCQTVEPTDNFYHEAIISRLRAENAYLRVLLLAVIVLSAVGGVGLFLTLVGVL